MSPSPASTFAPDRSDTSVLDRSCRAWIRRQGDPSSARLALIEMVAGRFAAETAPLVKSLSLGASTGSAELREVEELLDRYTFSADETNPDPHVITPSVLGTLYESTLRERRRQGVFYTPQEIVQFMCRRTLVESQGDRTTELRIIDPACGCGAFLVGMCLELEAWSREWGATGRPIPRVTLAGVDLDPVALRIAQFRLDIRKALSTAKRPTPAEVELREGDSLVLEHATLFDIVIGNPPYGVRAEIETRDRLFPPAEGPQARDVYGLFIARGLELLRPGGCLSFVVSDTWRTIRSHRPLRKRLLEATTVKHVIDLPGRTFDATVNTSILTSVKTPPASDHELISADLRNLDRDRCTIRNALDRATEPSAPDPGDDHRVSRYGQDLPQSYDTLPIITVSPSLFRRLTDPSLMRLGEVARIVQGLATGDNTFFVRRGKSANGPYQLIDETRVLTESELLHLSPGEKRGGVDPNDYGGRHFVPYDKGGSNFVREGHLSNYVGATDYYLDWSIESVARMRTRRSDRQGGRVASRFQNADCYFVSGLTWSDVGFYSPTFRLSGSGVFDVKGSRIIPYELDRYYLLGVLCSFTVRFFVKAIANHTVSTQVEDIRRIPLPPPSDRLCKEVQGLVLRILADGRRPGQWRGLQSQIDEVVADAYGLTEAERTEMHAWYARRYPVLVRSIQDSKANSQKAREIG